MSLQNAHSFAGSVQPLSHLTTYTPIESNVYYANPLATLVDELALQRLLTFHVPKYQILCLFPVALKHPSKSEALRNIS